MLRTKRFLFISMFLIILVVFAGVTNIQGQSTTGGKITGTITDDKGEVLPGANVEITSPAIMGKRSTVTSAKGTYVFLNLPVGTYKVSASVPNFKTVVQENVSVSAGIVLNVDLSLPLGAIEEMVTVTATSPIVDTRTSTIDSKLDRQMLDKLPASRDAFYDLSLTTPGMFDAGSSAGWLPSQTAYGGATNENIFMINGVNTTNPRGSSFGSLVSVNYNAVEEVRVVSIGSKAEYGSYSGAAIDVLTKSGSNQFHGSAAFYSQLAQPESNAPAPGDNLGKPWFFLERNTDGTVAELAGKTKTSWEGDFTLGAPIIKDKIWFYGAFDFSRGTEESRGVTTQSWGKFGDAKLTAEPFKNHRAWVSYHFENNKGTGWSWGTPPEWDPNVTYGSDTINNTISAQWQWLPSSKVILTAKYLGFWTDDEPNLPADAPDHPCYINWWKWAQYGINGAFPYVEAQKSSRQTVQADMSYYAEDFLGEHDIKFGVQYTKGRGNWMGGYFQNYVNFVYPVGGWAYNFNIDYLKGQTWYYGGAFKDGLLFYDNQYHLNPFLTVRTADSAGAFIDDQWSPTKRLTLNLGLRYDRMTTKYGVGKVYEYVTKWQDINGPPPVVRDRAASPNVFDFKTLSPRIGLTYLLTQDGKTVARANFGRYFQPLNVESLRRFGPDMPMTELHYLIYSIPWDVVDLNGNGILDLPLEVREAARQIYGKTPIYEEVRPFDQSWRLNVAPGLKDQYTDQFSLNIEREIVKDFSLSATYIYKRAGNIFANIPINRETGQMFEYDRVPFVTDSGQTVELYSIKWLDYNGDGAINGDDITWIGQHRSYVVQNMPAFDGAKPKRVYNGFQLVLNKRFSNRWQAMASVLYSLSSGFASRPIRQSQNVEMPMSTDDLWMPTPNFTINNMKGPLPFTPTFEFKFSGSYKIPYVELDLGFRYRMHTGNPVWRVENYPLHTRSAFPPGSVIDPGGSRIVSGDPTKPEHYATMSVLDLRLEKAFQVGRLGTFSVVLDGFNIFNANTVIGVSTNTEFGKIGSILSSRRFRFNLLFQF